MNLMLSVVTICCIALVAWAIGSSPAASFILTTAGPYVVFVVFLAGFVYRIFRWAKAPVPFRIPTTCGQAKSMPWVKTNPLENPTSAWGAVGRMAGEIFLFRSLFRNSTVEIKDGRPVYGSAKWLWFFGLMFHLSFLIVAVRHLRFFSDPILPCVSWLSALDGFWEVGVPALYLSDAALLAAVVFLLMHRVILPRMRYLSLFTDYFALLLIAAVAATGLLMRHVFPVDLNAVKFLTISWIEFAPLGFDDAGSVFSMHLCFVFVLIAWLPYSKLAHMGGVFMSPTRNLINNNRSKRHINPWNAPVKVHTYEEYEEEFREKMKAADLPVEKE